MKILLLLFILLSASAKGMHHSPVSELASYRAEERFVSDQILSRDFDRDVRPPGMPSRGDPVKVKVSLYIMELGLCPEKQELTVGGYFRQGWNDPRLKYDFGNETEGQRVVLNFRDMFSDRKIWIPDTFVVGDKYGWLANTLAETGGRSFSRVKCCGDVLASTKFRTSVICPVAKNTSSSKTVECKLNFESYYLTADDVVYEFKPNGLLVADQAKLLLKNQGWQMVSARPDNSQFAVQGRNYSGAQVVFKMRKL